MKCGQETAGDAAQAAMRRTDRSACSDATLSAGQRCRMM
jgi:hypothetical protein